MFQQLQENIRRQVARTVFKVKIEPQAAVAVPAQGGQPSEDGAAAAPTTRGAATPVLNRSATPDPKKLVTNRSDEGAAQRSAKSNKKSQRRKMLR